MKVHSITIPYKKEGTKFNLVAFGDAHVGAAQCHMDAFEDMLKTYGKAPNTYLVDVGDACDCVIPADKKRYRVEMVHPMFRGADDVVDKQIDWYVSMIQKHVEPGRFLGLISGNHMDDISKRCSTNPTKRISKLLSVPNLGYTCFYRLLFKRPGRAFEDLTIYIHHGWGGACRTEGANMTKYCGHTKTIDKAKVFLFGHNHECWTKTLVRIEPCNGKIHEVPMIVAECGTFLKTLSNSATPSYSEEEAYPPRGIGHVLIEITTPTETHPYFGLKGTV